METEQQGIMHYNIVIKYKAEVKIKFWQPATTFACYSSLWFTVLWDPNIHHNTGDGQNIPHPPGSSMNRKTNNLVFTEFIRQWPFYSTYLLYTVFLKIWATASHLCLVSPLDNRFTLLFLLLTTLFPRIQLP